MLTASVGGSGTAGLDSTRSSPLLQPGLSGQVAHPTALSCAPSTWVEWVCLDLACKVIINELVKWL